MAEAPPSPSLAAAPLLRPAMDMVRRAEHVLRGDNERTRTQRDAVTAFGVRVASAAILYLSQVALARWMGAHEYGIYVFVWTWVLMLSGVSVLGLSIVMIRLVPEYLERRQYALLRGLLLGSRLAVLLTGTLIAVLALLVLWVAGNRLGSHYVLPMFIALACVPLCALTDLQDGIGRGRGWMAAGLVPPYILRPLLLLACMAAAHFWGLPTNAVTAAGAAVLATWGAVIVQAMLITRRFSAEIPNVRRTYAFKTWIAAALPLLAILACDLVLQNMDVLVLSAYTTPAEVGMYFAASKTMSLILFIHYAVGSAFANRFSALNARGDHEGLTLLVSDAVRWTFWPSLSAAAVILALGTPLLWLFNPQFTAAYPVMFVLAVGFLIRASIGPADFLLNMLGEQKLCAAVLMTSAVLDVALMLVLVPRFGMLGAAMATSAALTAAAILNYGVARRRLGLRISIWDNLGPDTKGGQGA